MEVLHEPFHASKISNDSESLYIVKHCNEKGEMSMNLNKVSFNNLGAVETIAGFGENMLVRIPEKVRNQLNNGARFMAKESVGIEIQFVTDAPTIDIYLSVLRPVFSECGKIRIYKGNFLYKIFELQSGIVHTVRINPPGEFGNVKQNMLYSKGFSPNVWRVVCDRLVVSLHGIDTYGYDIRPPEKNELPPKNWLAYGSSITHSNLDGYPFVAARQLGIQVQNKGLCGSCHIEKEIVDYFFDEVEFDLITCELGVNMRGGFTPEEFEKRARYLVERIKESKKPAVIITTFPNKKSIEYTDEFTIYTEHELAYNKILIDLVKGAQYPDIHLVHGYDILTDVCGLSADLLHPTSYGHALMGLNLAGILCKIGLV